MKKYHLADLFTLLEVILAIALFIAAVSNAPVEWALYIFVAGELCDAVDGPCARRWHYPDDGKYRWWREYNSETDQASDILLAISCGVYLIWRVSVFWGIALLGGIGLFCLAIQCYIFRYDHIRHTFVCRDNPHIDDIVLFRRHIYVIAGIGGAIALMVWSTSWPLIIKRILMIVGIICGLILLKLKWNRWKENKTKL